MPEDADGLGTFGPKIDKAKIAFKVTGPKAQALSFG
ncbi:hypothetical protein SDC9_177110 [bioreactor metagenome]|uniref:Uncharacterized protein n=1 Tax=bioreactor metagenome TaxID=1076179 RepID=A0A645GRY1_9ZZZZ